MFLKRFFKRPTMVYLVYIVTIGAVVYFLTELAQIGCSLGTLGIGLS